NAPKELLRALNVFVVGAISENPEAEVITLFGPANIPEAIICAVPYLRDRDIRTVEAGETVADKNAKLIGGVQKHYAEICRIAEKKQEEYGNIPIIGMGHLFTTGGKTIDGDGVRELYVGSLAHVGEDIFPDCIDYLALGHLHVPQKVGKSEHIRYCGSPIPMGYGEATQEKKVVLVEFDGRTPQINEHPIPCFQALERISGGIDEISAGIDALKSQASNAWLEIEYTGTKIAGNLQGLINEAIAGTDMEVRRIKNRRDDERVSGLIDQKETLDDLDVNEVFIRCLDSYEVTEEERPKLIQAYKEIVQHLQEEDLNED
ncbi:MAG: exonuclease SbcCD subunit D C-terminal domain-containing protein, partial [Deltaproteobacteria bacterium]|nr:exonuclease SbcCD subunit D C-terminal domain-containing protein [Deltaproteobacteria bacterium]